MKKKYNIIDLFAGCGGLEDGFYQTSRYNCIASVEWLKPQVETLRNRLKTKWKISDSDNKVLHFDIQRECELFNGWINDNKFGSSLGLDHLVNSGGGVDLIIGGPPCQAYSIAGRVRDKKGMHDDYRNFLFEHYLNVVKRYKPKLFLFENVTGILSASPKGINIVDAISKSFKEIGYTIPDNLKDIAVLNAADYGVPQNRKRVIILGVRSDLNKHNIITSFYKDFLKKYQVNTQMTVGEAIGDLSKFKPVFDKDRHMERNVYEGVSSVDWHKPRYHNVRDMKIFSMLAQDIEMKVYQYADSKAISKVYEKFVGSKSPIHRYHVLKEDAPSTTILAHLYKDGNRFIHYDSSQARSITPREAARLQSFDDDFKFIGSQGSIYQMIGNAVPPKLAKALALALLDFMDTYFEG